MNVCDRPATDNEVLDYLFPAEGGSLADPSAPLLKSHLSNLLRVMDLEKQLHAARVYGKSQDDRNALELALDDARGDCERLKQDTADDAALRLRFTAESFPHLNFVKRLDEIESRIADLEIVVADGSGVRS